MLKPAVATALGLALTFASGARAEGELETPKLDTGAISGALVQKEGAAPIRV